ncbi:hypothetical protein HDV00_011595, partial [Rhizophlyctis rosea]
MSATNQTSCLQLAVTGPMDTFLYDKPESSMFAYNQTRVSNHASDPVMLEFEGPIAFGKTLTVTLPHRADLLHEVSIMMVLPPLTPTTGSTYAGYAQCTIYAIIETVELLMNEQVVNSRTGLDLEIFDYITTPPGAKATRDKQVNRFDTVNVLPQNALGVTTLFAPLPLFFTKKMASSLPVLSLYRDTMRLRLRLRPFEDVVVYDGPTPPHPVNPLNINLLAEYIHFTSVERASLPTFKNPNVGDPLYLIEQVQSQVAEITAATVTTKVPLEFTNNVKEILFVVVETASEENNNYCNFGRRDPSFAGGELIIRAGLLLDGQERFARMPES